MLNKLLRDPPKILIAGLALCVCLASALPCFAENVVVPGNAGHSELVLIADSPVFNVTVPSVLAVGMLGDGTIVTSSDAKIVNNSAGPVEVTGLQIAAKDGWSVMDWDTYTPSRRNYGAKEIALTINGCKTTGPNVITFDKSLFNIAMGVGTGENEIPITYDAKIPIQGEILQSRGILDVYFILSWHTGS